MASEGPVRAGSQTSKKVQIGHLLRERRAYHGWTLAQVSAKTGISRSALSKIENDLISPSYQTIIQLCQGLEIEIGDLVNPGEGRPASAQRPIMGRRSISYQGSGQTIENEQFSYTYLCSDVAHKRIIPMIVEVRAKSMAEIGTLWAHVGEEYIYVLKGSVEIRTEFYEPVTLEVGDSIYFDSTMGHAYLSVGESPATLLVTCSSATPNLAQTLREILKERLAAQTQSMMESPPLRETRQPRAKRSRRVRQPA